MVIGETLHPLHKHGHLPGKKQDLPNVSDNAELPEYIGTSPPSRVASGETLGKHGMRILTPSTLNMVCGLLAYSAILHFQKFNSKIFRFIIFNALIILLIILRTKII